MANPPQSRCYTGTDCILPYRHFSDTFLQHRNKPKERPKVPERAPFFLPTLPGIEPRFALETKEKESKKPTKKLEKGSSRNVQSAFVNKLVAEAADGDCE